MLKISKKKDLTCKEVRPNIKKGECFILGSSCLNKQ